jgi:hypothetical protein
MSKKKKDNLKMFPKETFTHNPVAFGALMEFQYGKGEDQQEAERLLLEENKGIACKIEELPIVLPNLNFWLSLGKKERKPKQFRLYMNGRLASLLGATILMNVGIEFDVVPVTTNSLYCYGTRHPLPILVDLKKGTAACSLQEVKNQARCVALQKWGKLEYPCHPYYPHHIDFRNDGWYRDKNNKLQHAEVWCFNEKNECTFLGKIQSAPYPVSKMLKAHWYVQQMGEGAFDDLVVWDLGVWLDLKQKVNENGHLIQPNPPVVLFADELRSLDGKKRVIVNDHGCAYCVQYDAYFLINGRLYRIYGNMMD